MKKIKEDIIEKCKSLGLDKDKIKVNNNYARIGLCGSNGIIELSKQSLKYNNEEAQKYLILHEKTHLTHFNHKKEFKEELKDKGVKREDMIPITRYIIFCPRCKEYARANKIKIKDYECGYCKKKNIKQKLMIYKHVQT